MGQILLKDNIPLLAIGSTTTVTLASTFLGQPTRITIGGRQYLISATLTFSSAASTGKGYLDTGAIAANTLYYVYAVVTSGAVGLVASTAAPATGPTGFTAWTNLGRFRTRSGGTEIAAVADWLNGVLRSPAIDAWGTYTPTGGWTTFTTYTGMWRRVGSDMEIDAKIATSNVPGGSSAFTLNLPTGYTIDTNVLTEEVTSYSAISGIAMLNDSTTTAYRALPVYNSTTSIRLNYQSATSGAVTGVSSSSPFATNSGVHVMMSVPIVEFSGLYT
jgi:hypothetical protein